MVRGAMAHAELAIGPSRQSHGRAARCRIRVPHGGDGFGRVPRRRCDVVLNFCFFRVRVSVRKIRLTVVFATPNNLKVLYQ